MNLENDPLPGVQSAAMLRLQTPRHFERFREAPATTYELRVFMAAAELKGVFEELEYTIGFIERAFSFPELTALLKLYVISWVSLSDLLASLLNEVFDLGIGEQDVEFGAILRNRHIVSTEVPQIVKRHAASLRYDEFARMRNDIVHRGKLGEKELDSIHGDFLMGIAKRIPVFTDDDTIKASVTEAARKEANVETRIREFVEKKQSSYSQHLSATRVFLREIAGLLVSSIEQHVG